MNIPCETCISFAICKTKVIRRDEVYLSNLFEDCEILRETTHQYCKTIEDPYVDWFFGTHPKLYAKAFKLFMGKDKASMLLLDTILTLNRDELKE